MKLIDADKIQVIGGTVIYDNCPIAIDKGIVDSLVKYYSVDISDKYISIDYLYKSLVDALYERKISSETMQIFYEILGGWRDESNTSD